MATPLNLESVGDGRYELADVLGAGGMGLVHHGRDTVLGRDVAVKILADNLSADPDARERFEREARAAGRLNHPNVVAVFDVGEEQGRPYFVMELVDGPSYADVLRSDGTLSAAEAQKVAEHALAGLGHSHDAGLLHRDLKPGNLLRDPDGTVKVTDFGVAQAAEDPKLTRTGLVLGTLPYLAPERLAGGPASVASDLYALGATLLELLTGAPPPTPDSTTPPANPGELLDTVPPRLARFIERCLATDPAQRPASARDGYDELTSTGPLATAPAHSELAETVAVSAVPSPDATQILDADQTVAQTLPPTAPDDTDSPRPFRLNGWARWAAFAGLAVVVVLALGQMGGDDGSPGAPDDGATGTPAQTEPAADPTTDPATDPADEGGSPGDVMRDLGDTLDELGQ